MIGTTKENNRCQTAEIILQEENTMFTKMLRNYLEMLKRNSEEYFAEKSETVSAFYCMAD